MNTKTNTSNHSHSQKATAAAVPGSVIKLGQDVHAGNVVVVVQLDGSLPQPPQKIPIEKYVRWVKQLKEKHPGAKLHACYEAGPCGYWLHRVLEELGVHNHVVAPVALNGRRKCDNRDAGALEAQLDRYVAGNTKAFSVVRVPEVEVEQQRALLRHREALVRSLRRAGQQGRSLLLLHGRRVSGAWWGRRRWPELKETLPQWQCDLLADFQAQAELLHAQIRALDLKIAALAKAKKVDAPRGIGELTWLTLQLEVGDWGRFDNRREVASYSGLCAGEDSTGETRREGSIDKRGNRRVRHALVEAAWRLLRWQPGYKPLERVREAKGSRARRRAIVAAARRLAIDLWRLATGRTTREKVGLAATT